MNEDIREILKHEAEAVLNIPVSDKYDEAIGLIVEQVHKKHGKLVTSGMGKAGQIALNMSTTFSSTGTPSVFLHPSEAQHGDLGIIQENDIMLLISNSGKTREIVELIPLTRRLRPDIKFIVITGNEDESGSGCGCVPAYRQSKRGLYLGADADHVNHGDDCHW